MGQAAYMDALPDRESAQAERALGVLVWLVPALVSP